MNRSVRALLLTPLVAVPMTIGVSDMFIVIAASSWELGLVESLFNALLLLLVAASWILIHWYALAFAALLPLHLAAKWLRVRSPYIYVFGFTSLVCIWDFVLSNWLAVQLALSPNWLVVPRIILQVLTAAAISWLFWRIAILNTVPLKVESRIRQRASRVPALVFDFARTIASGLRTGRPRWVVLSAGVAAAVPVFLMLNGPVGEPTRSQGRVVGCGPTVHWLTRIKTLGCAATLDDGSLHNFDVSGIGDYRQVVTILRFQRRLFGTQIVVLKD